jgi:hypothetical protein
MPFVAVDMTTFAADASTKNINPGSTWVVTENAKLRNLTIAEGAAIITPGKSLTMIADGVETGIKHETYRNVELVITDRLNSSPVGTSNRMLTTTALRSMWIRPAL